MAEVDKADWLAIESKFYAFLTRNERIGDTAQQHIFAPYAAHFTAGQRVLDVGPGQGEFLDLLRERGVTGFGLDHDAGMVAESRRRGHTVFESDAIAFLQTTRRRFDGVFMGNFVEHFAPQDVLALLAGAFRVLRPGGLLIAATIDPRSLHVHLQEFWRDATHVRFYDRDLLAFMTEVSGFTVREVGSNDVTAYTPGEEWFGAAFAARLAAIGPPPDGASLFPPEPASPAADAPTAHEESPTLTPADAEGDATRTQREPPPDDRATRDLAMVGIEARLATVQETMERVQRDAARTTQAMRQEITDLRATLDARPAVAQPVEPAGAMAGAVGSATRDDAPDNDSDGDNGNDRDRTAAGIEARLATVQETMERVQRDAAQTTQAMRQEVADLRAALDAYTNRPPPPQAEQGMRQEIADLRAALDAYANRPLLPPVAFDPASLRAEVAPLPAGVRYADEAFPGHSSHHGENGVRDALIAPPPLIPERHSAIAFQRWKGDTAISRYIPEPRLYHRPQTDLAGTVPQAVFDLMMNIFDEVRLTTEATNRQHDRLDQLERRLDGLGEIVALTQGEMVQSAQAMRARIETVQDAVRAGLATQEATARRIAEELDAVWRAFANVQQARDATAAAQAQQFEAVGRTVHALSDQVAAQFEDLYTARAAAAAAAAANAENIRSAVHALSDQVTAQFEDLYTARAAAAAAQAQQFEAVGRTVHALSDQVAAQFEDLYTARAAAAANAENINRAVRALSDQVAAQFEDLSAAQATATATTTAWLEDLQRATQDLSHLGHAQETAAMHIEALQQTFATAMQQTAHERQTLATGMQQTFATAMQQTASEAHARIAAVDTMREQMRSIFGHLYPPREYFVVAVRGDAPSREHASGEGG